MTPKRSTRGFSLLEIIIALMLLSGVAMVVMSSFSASTRVVSGGGERNVASNFGRSILERMFEYVKADATWTAPGGPLSLSAPGPQNVGMALNGQNYTASYSVNSATTAPIDADGDGEEDYRTVDLTVSW